MSATGRIEVKFGLTEKELGLITDALKRFPEIEKVKIFGSRAKGEQKYNSDVDLAFWGDFDDRVLGQIYRMLDDLPLAYSFDVKKYDSITHLPVREHIDKYGIELLVT